MTGEISNIAHEVAGASGGFTRGSIPMWGTFILALGALVVRLTPLYEVWKRLTMTANDKLIADLQADGAFLRAELRKVREESAKDRDHCREENEKLRTKIDSQHDEMVALRDELHGLRKQVTLQQADRIVTMIERPSPDVVAAAARVAKLP